MGSYGELFVDGVTVGSMKNGVPTEICAVFSDSMLRRRKAKAQNYYTDSDLSDDELVDVYELVASGQTIVDRLDLLGFDRTCALTNLDDSLEDARELYASRSYQNSIEEVQAITRNELAHLDGYTAVDWIRDFRAAARHPDSGDRFVPGSRSWLFHYIEGLDDRIVLRAILLSLPDAEVRLDITDLVSGGWLDQPEGLCS